MLTEIQKGRALNILSMYEDEGIVFLKSQDVEELVKGRMDKPIGSKETWGGKDYMKTANGWKAVGKNGGAAKAAHDYVHGEKKEEVKVEEPVANAEEKVPLHDVVSKYGWIAKKNGDDIELYNRNGKMVSTVKQKGSKYTFLDSSGDKLMTGSGQLEVSAERLLKTHWYAKLNDNVEKSSSYSAVDNHNEQVGRILSIYGNTIKKSEGSVIDMDELKSQAKKIKHCGDYGHLYAHEDGRVFWICGDSDGSEDTTSMKDIESMLGSVAGVTKVNIEAEGGVGKDSGYNRVEY